MKQWQRLILYFIVVVGAIILPWADYFHIPLSPLGLTGYAAVCTNVLGDTLVQVVRQRTRQKDDNNDE